MLNTESTLQKNLNLVSKKNSPFWHALPSLQKLHLSEFYQPIKKTSNQTQTNLNLNLKVATNNTK